MIFSKGVNPLNKGFDLTLWSPLVFTITSLLSRCDGENSSGTTIFKINHTLDDKSLL